MELKVKYVRLREANLAWSLLHVESEITTMTKIKKLIDI